MTSTVPLNPLLVDTAVKFTDFWTESGWNYSEALFEWVLCKRVRLKQSVAHHPPPSSSSSCCCSCAVTAAVRKIKASRTALISILPKTLRELRPSSAPQISLFLLSVAHERQVSADSYFLEDSQSERTTLIRLVDAFEVRGTFERLCRLVCSPQRFLFISTKETFLWRKTMKTHNIWRSHAKPKDVKWKE